MKCSDFYKLRKALQDRERSEIDDITEDEEDSDDYYDKLEKCPCIACNPDNYDPEPMDIYVLSAYLDKKYDVLELNCISKDGHYEQSVDVDDIFPGQLEYVIEKIPATDEVSDVSEM